MASLTLPVNAMDQVTQAYMSLPKVTVASLWPMEIKYPRPYKTDPMGGFHTDYGIAAAPFDGPPTTTKIGWGMIHQHMGSRQYGAVPEQGGAVGIAKDFVRHCRNVPGASGAAHPAVWICAGDEPTAEEIATHREAQVRLARARIILADKNHLTGHRDQITDYERTLASWMKIDPRMHPWMLNEEKGATKKCTFCRSDIDFEASVCTNCHQIVDPKLFARQKLMRDALMAEAEKLNEELVAAARASGEENPEKAAISLLEED